MVQLRVGGISMKRTPVILLMIVLLVLILTYIISYRNNTLKRDDVKTTQVNREYETKLT